MSKVEIDKEDFLKLLNQIQKIAESSLFKERFAPHDWGKVGEELGVSVYEAHKNINGLYSPVLPMPTNIIALDTFLHLIRYYSGKKYLVTGDVLPFVGTDGEPLIKNVKILKEL